MPRIKVNDISMYYEQHGQGDLIVFIAGFSADHTAWSTIIESFKEKYQVILLDNRGIGQTDIADGLYSIEQMANDVADLCSVLDIQRAHFVGSSMGGFILQSLAYRYPTLVQSAIIVNSAAKIDTVFHVYLSAQLEFMKANTPLKSLIKASCSWCFSSQFLSQPGVLDQLIQIGLDNPFPFTVKGYEGQYAALEQFDSRGWLEQIKVPVFVLTADQDIIISARDAKYLADNIPGSRYHCFTECGHLPQLEDPEQFVQLVREFIETLK